MSDTNAKLDKLLEHLQSLDKRMEKVEKGLDAMLSRFQIPVEGFTPPNINTALAARQAALARLEKPLVQKSGPYIYEALGPNEIRVLSVYNSATDEEPIRVDISKVTLNNSPSPSMVIAGKVTMGYQALSYTWGSPEKTGSIILNGHIFPVTKNLETALRYMRGFKRPAPNPRMSTHSAAVTAAVASTTLSQSHWWVDAICINQDDVLERNQQISIMTRIYKKCSAVHAWLGEAADDSDMAMNVAEELSKYRQKGPGEATIEYPDVSSNSKMQHWKALTALFQRPWWNRAWIIQEAVLPSAVNIHCGKMHCTLDHLSKTASIMMRINDHTGYVPVPNKVPSDKDGLKPSSYSQVLRLNELRGEASSGRFLDLGKAVMRTRTCEATDMRDKVFGVLGLVDAELYPFKPDYRISIAEAYKRATMTIMLNTNNIDILSGCQNPERLHGLPSWVPNLEDPWKTQVVEYNRSQHNYAASSECSFEGENETILRARGYLDDTIYLICDNVITGDDSHETLFRVYRNWKNFVMNAIAKDEAEDGPLAHPNYNLTRFKHQNNEHDWIGILSLGTENWSDFEYSKEDSSLLPRVEPREGTWTNYKMSKSYLLPMDEDGNSPKIDPYWRILRYVQYFGLGRKLAITKRGSICLVPAESKAGDEVCTILGAFMRYVMRKIGENYVIVGDTYSKNWTRHGPSSYRWYSII